MINSVNLFGRITKDIEIKKTNTGKSVADFSLAVQRDKEHTGFIPCRAWEGRAETLARYVKKGHQLAIGGHLQTNSYETSGKKHTFINVIVSDFALVSRPKEEQAVPVIDDPTLIEDNQFDIKMEDIPF